MSDSSWRQMPHDICFPLYFIPTLYIYKVGVNNYFIPTEIPVYVYE